MLVVVIGAILAMFVHGVMVYDDPIVRTGAAVAFLFCVWRTVKMIRDIDDGEGDRRAGTGADGN